MGSASQSALATGVTALAAAKDVTLATGEQLLTAARAIDGSAQLRSLMADPTLDPAERGALVAQVFGTLDETARGLLQGLAASRWSNPAQLVDGVEEIGIRALARAAQDTDIVSELFAVERAVASDPELELALGSKLAPAEAKAATVTRLLATQGSPATVALVRHLVQSPRGRRIGALLQSAAAIVADVAGDVVAIVTTASALTDVQRQAIITDLTQRFGRTPRLQVRIDPSVVGGVRVRIGDTVIDGTVASRLADLRLRLAG